MSMRTRTHKLVGATGKGMIRKGGMEHPSKTVQAKQTPGSERELLHTLIMVVSSGMISTITSTRQQGSLAGANYQGQVQDSKQHKEEVGIFLQQPRSTRGGGARIRQKDEKIQIKFETRGLQGEFCNCITWGLQGRFENTNECGTCFLDVYDDL